MYPSYYTVVTCVCVLRTLRSTLLATLKYEISSNKVTMTQEKNQTCYFYLIENLYFWPNSPHSHGVRLVLRNTILLLCFYDFQLFKISHICSPISMLKFPSNISWIWPFFPITIAIS